MAGILDFSDARFENSPMWAAIRENYSPNTPDLRVVKGIDLTPTQEDADAPIQSPQFGTQAPRVPQGILSQIGDGLSQFGSGLSGFAKQNPDLLMAMAGGMGQGRTPLAGLGGAFAAGSDELNKQEHLKQQHELALAALQQKKEQLEEAKRLNTGKLNAFAAKAMKDGMPKKIGGMGGFTTLAWPDGSITSHEDADVQRIFDNVEAGKTERAALIGAGKLQGTLLTDPKQLEEDAKLQQNYDSARQAFEDYKETKKLFEDTGGVSTFSRVVPGMPWLNQKLGTQDGLMQQKLSKLNLGGFLQYVKGFPGALSDKEGARIAAAIPPSDAGPEIWDDFFKHEGPKLEQAMGRVEAIKQERATNKEKIMSLPSTINGGSTTKTQQSYPSVSSSGLDALRGTLADPNATPSAKKTASDKLVSLLNSGQAKASDADTYQATALQKAKAAIDRGADRNKVVERLKAAGIDASTL